MDIFLTSIGLENLISILKQQKLEVGQLQNLSDQQLISLGVTALGDRVRIRECSKTWDEKATEGQSTSTMFASSSTLNNTSPAGQGINSSALRTERNRLFSPYAASSQTQRKKYKSKKVKKRPWTASFFCLDSPYQLEVPKSKDKAKLNAANLGNKKILLSMEDDEETVMNNITSSSPNGDLEPSGFPALKNAGGFELLIRSGTTSSSSMLKLITGELSAKNIRKQLPNTQTLLYIRPIQKSLHIDIDESINTSKLQANCLQCGMLLNLTELRKHIQSNHPVRSPAYDVDLDIDSNLSTDPDELNNPQFATSLSDSLPAFDHLSTTLSGNTVATPTPTTTGITTQPTNSTDSTNSFVDVHAQLSNENASAFVGSSSSINTPSGNADEVSTSDANNDIIFVDSNSNVDTNNIPNHTPSLQALIDSIKDQCLMGGCEQNSSDILRIAQTTLMSGRSLEIYDQDIVPEGETNFVLVDRSNLITTSFEEIRNIENKHITLEVQFYNETAEDYGGPRKEFFRLVLYEIKERYFDHGLNVSKKDDYVTIGNIVGMSILQNGSIPKFFGKNGCAEIFHASDPSPCYKKLRQGLEELGIVQLCNRLPALEKIFDESSYQTLTLKTVTRLLQAEFAEKGSNIFNFENTVYTMLMQYLREVASGRRENISLEKVLAFITGIDEIPPLGFQIAPGIKFTESSSFLPQSSTCINKLYLPRPNADKQLPKKDVLFNLYDLAFANTYFGIV